MEEIRQAPFPPQPQMPDRPLVDAVSNHLWTGNTRDSRRTHAILPILLYPLCFIVITACICVIIWLARHGPMLVPGQDTRKPAIVISIGARLAGIIISAALFRSAWVSFVKEVVTEEPIPIQTLIGVCGNFNTLGQWRRFCSLPHSFQLHIVLGILTSIAMSATSSSFRYVSLPEPGRNFALVPDVLSSCNKTLVNGTNYFCSGNLGVNTTNTSWNYLETVYSGGSGTVSQYGEPGAQELGANVTLAVLPPGWTLSKGHNLPWMAIWVTCRPLTISAQFVGSNINTVSNIFVDGLLLDQLDIANMPSWSSIVRLYQQVNQSGPASSLTDWKVVMLARDLEDGTASSKGLTYLGSSFLDLHGYGPAMQGVLGAAALCSFNGSTGGEWPNDLWPPLNHTPNRVVGTVIDDQPTMGTALLNYGPSWQYNPVSDNSLPGGSVSYIANVTGVVKFPTLFTAYIRNQWMLMAYSIAQQSGSRISLPFVGTGPSKLYITLTYAIAFPCTALGISLLVILHAWTGCIGQRYWVERVEFESWWLIKALRPDMYRNGCSNAGERDFHGACKGFSATYRDIGGNNAGNFVLCPTRPS